MIIPLRVKRFFPDIDRLFPIADVIVRHGATLVRTEAFVDTGSFRTSIAPRDVERMRIRVETLPPSSPRHSRIGGFVIPTYSLKNVTLTFWDEAKKPVRIELSAIDVLGFPERVKGIEYLPTIIGTDFLEDQKFALYFDPSHKKSHLEKSRIVSFLILTAFCPHLSNLLKLDWIQLSIGIPYDDFHRRV